MPLETCPYFPDKNNYVQVLKNPLEKTVVGGKLAVPTTPGLGAEVGRDAIEPFRSFDYRKDAA